MMSTGEDEPSSGLNGRLRPRKSTIPSPQTTKNLRKPDAKSAQEKPKRTTTPSKVSPNKLDDLTDKSDTPALQILCPYCDKSFVSKQTVSKHIARIHLLTSKQDNIINCLFCNHIETDSEDIIRHMVDNHPNQYFACYDCHTRFPSTTALAEHKLNVCEKQKLPYRNKLRQKTTQKKGQNSQSNNGRDDSENEDKNYSGHTFNSIVISCELKPSHPHDPIDIENNITTNLILPSSKSLGNSNVIEKNAIIVLDDLQWNKRIPPNFSFHNTDADQILSRLGVVHRSPRTGESNKKDLFKHIDDAHQKFEKCFDTSFYSKVASNVQENLFKYLDGSFNFNPDPENTIKTRKTKNIVAINTVEGFPILLAAEQFCRNVFDGYMPRTIAPKHKWKWDNLESDKNFMSPEQIKRDSHTNNCIITLVSSLDIWTQLCMRRKFEEKFSTSPVEKRTDKQNIIGKELKEILESRELPTSSSQVVKYTAPQLQARDNSDFPASLGLVPNAPNFDIKPAVLSGEWVRPRCYVCCACGAQTCDSKALSSHISTQHPNAQIQHYEIVGEVLLNSDILKHLYVPPSQLNNRTRPLRGFKECTKCKKGISLEDLHQHMLDCAGDTPTVRRKCRYRPFGVRKRRPRLPDNTIRKEMRKDIRHSRHNRKTLMRPRPKIRTEVGDAETIRKMLADLPAKRHRAIVNPLNPILRPRRKLNKQRTKLVMKKRAMDEMIKKPQSTVMSKEGNFKNQDPQKSSHGSHKPDNNAVQPINKSVKRVATGILSQNSSLRKKNPINKNRRKTFVTKKSETITECSDVPQTPVESDSNKPIDQLSMNSNSERININDGSQNTRQHGNSNNGSNNKDAQQPGFSGQNSNSRDSFGPSQNVPLKHSIARLTASSETHDKSVQFHHLFLVQQECNNTTQHLPSGPRMLFENEAVVTKLDKPPLHFNHVEMLDPQGFQRSKLNKPRKGLNDCIAMLKNKLVEPNSTILPGHVSVQCGSDEPLGPEPIVIERRHSTADSNVIESAQRSLQMYYPDKIVDDIPLNYNTSTRVTRRSSTRQSSRRDKFTDIQPNNDFMYWNQFYYNKQMLPAAQNNYKYKKRESTRRRSVVSTEDLLLQHAINMELIANSSRGYKNTTNYPFQNISPPQKPPRKTRQNSQKTRSNSNINKTKAKTKSTPRGRQKKVIDSNITHGNNNQILPDGDLSSIRKENDRCYENSLVNNTNMNPMIENIDQYYLQGRVEDKSNDLSKEKTMLHTSNMPEEQLNTNLYQNTPIMQYSNEYNIVPDHYNMHVDSTLTAPLDLSNNILVEDTRHYVPEEQYSAVTYANYETLDLSNRYINTLPENDTRVSNDEVVDLRMTYNPRSLLSRSPHLPPEQNETDLLYVHPDTWVSEANDCVPTDLSMKRKDIPSDSFEKRRLYDGALEINAIQDLSHPTRHVHDIRMIIPYRDDLENEEPTDLSIWRTESRSNLPAVCISEEQFIRLNQNDEEIPADLSSKSREIIHNNYYTDEQRMPHYLEAVVSNNRETGPIIDPLNTKIPLNSIESEQMNNAHYNYTGRISPQVTALEPRPITTFSEPTLNETQIMSATEFVSPPSVTCELSTSINENGTSNDVNYITSEMPLSLSTKTANEATVCNLVYRETSASDYEYEYQPTSNIRPTCTLTQQKENDALSRNDNLSVNTSTAYTVDGPVTETSTVYESSSSSIINQPNIIDSRKLSRESEDLEGQKHFSKEKSPVPNYILETENNIPALKDNNDKVNSDQDPETARKIAMLPKELVEILGNMPVDHRNQLLNVLPQYVSSSTSPILLSHDTESCRRDSTSHSTNASSPTLITNKLEIDYKTSVTSEDGHMLLNHSLPSHNLHCVETSPTAFSSSILLTPPTPQQSDRHSNQSNENYETKMIEHRRKSQISVEKETPEINKNSESAGSYTTADEYDGQERIIDLTDDSEEILSQIPDVSKNCEKFTNSNSTTNTTCPSKDIPNSINTPKSKALKTNSDKTASLRAVRIKTSSERQRAVLSENIMIKKNNDTASNLIEEEQKNKCIDIIRLMAIQQAEVTSTQQRAALESSNSTIPINIDVCTEKQETTEKPIEDMTKDAKTVCDVNHTIPTEQSVIIPSLVENKTNSDLEDEIKNDSTCNANKNDATKTSPSLKPIKKKSPKTDKGSHLYLKKFNGLVKNKITNENGTLLSFCQNHELAQEDDDSEDDVSLAFIVKRKHRNLNVCDDENTVKGNKKSEQKTSDKLLSDQQNQVLLSCNKTISAEKTNLCESQSLKNSLDVCNDTNTIECSENVTKEKGTYSKKKGRKGRRVNILGTTQYVDQQEHLCNTNEVDTEHDINKENSHSSEIVKNVEMIEDTVKTKSNELDNRSTSNNMVITNDKEVTLNASVRKEKTKVMINLSSGCLTYDKVNPSEQNSEAVIEGNNAVRGNSTKESHENKLSITSIDTVCTATNTEDEKIEINRIPQLTYNTNKIVENQAADLKRHCDLNKNTNSKNIVYNKASIEKEGETEVDETSMISLRRSRRGKSLFIDSNSIVHDNILNADNSKAHRAPLTKKQLIFSKLLLDEENHNKPIFTVTANKQIAESLPKAQIEPQQGNDSDDELNKFDGDEDKTNKRKKSLQSKRKSKKKKSFTVVNLDDEPLNNMEEIQNLSTNNITLENVLSTPHAIELNTKNITVPTTDAIIDAKQLIEKRKSTSPDRDDLMSIAKPKKLKLNSEETMPSQICEKEIKAKEISKEDTLSTAVISRNTTCYNKAIRRARSKSVVVKSSGAELYDPYDIDLEDMVDETEPFVRKECSPKTRFTALKSVVAVKTRKLGKTPPSTIDILPSDATPSSINAENCKIDVDKTNTVVEYNNNSSVNTKDGSSDSDESSKSDVPLKKYVEEKEKKLTEISPRLERVEKSTDIETYVTSQEKYKPRKKNKQKQLINNKDLKVVSNKTDNEEELRSEQFMESFGFFSERKPRKSNLLATKKISETFNLIENDDAYFASKERVPKKSTNCNKKEDQVKTKNIISSPKKAAKRGRKKRRRSRPKPSFCDVCKKVFRRRDNYARHLFHLYHISRLCEVELKVKTVLIEEEPNYLIAYRQQMYRLKLLQNKIAKREENCLSTDDIILPTLEQMLADVKRTVQEQQLSRRRVLSRDEVLFIDCCEMLKESHNNDITTVNKRVRQCNSFNCAQTCQEELALLDKSIADDRCDIKSDDEMDSVAAKKILESEEVRNLENDLISNLKEANGIGPLSGIQIQSSTTYTNSITDSHTILSHYENREEPATVKYKQHNEVKEKMYPDIVDNIDMFEDKFDKIKRKCRSQAAAAKQTQTHIETNARYKNSKKSEKKKVNNRKGCHNTVPTKAALKGFDGVKVSILTSDINMPAIVSSVEKVHKKKRKSGSKKKKDRTNSEKSSHRDSDLNTEKPPQKKVDVYEFMDTEDTEVFEFRPSTLMERFKSINNKEMPSTSKSNKDNEFEISSESGSDGDDFVYMSDDYVCSDDETENSILSCELGNGKGINEHNKTSSLLKRKDTAEKNAVMGKIFKHNAVRTERKSPKNKECIKPKANLDQLFDSLLEDGPKTSALTNDDSSAETDEVPPSRVYLSLSPQKDDQLRFNKSAKRYDQTLFIASESGLSQMYMKPSPTLHPSLSSFSRRKSTTPPSKLETDIKSILTLGEYASSAIKRKDDYKKSETIKEYDASKERHTKKYESLLSRSEIYTASKPKHTHRRRSDDHYYEKLKSRDELYNDKTDKHKSKDKTDKKKKEESKHEGFDFGEETFNQITSEDAGVARQRARRKCTVGKQNVLAETWSSESEPDGVPPRPNSADSVVAGSGRKKKGRKKEGQSNGNRKATKLVSVKKNEYESRVGSSNRGAGSGSQARPRSPPYYWSEGGDEQEHPQQHGWIVGDSHKKLVTMLAHAKGRKRSGDEKRHMLE